MIRKGDQKIYSRIRKLSDFGKLRLGQGDGWNDIPNLEANKLRVVRGPNYQGLFGMLSLARFDYFPRGVNEILPELSTHQPKYPDLAIEEDLLLHYPFPVYFFVAKNTPRTGEAG